MPAKTADRSFGRCIRFQREDKTASIAVARRAQRRLHAALPVRHRHYVCLKTIAYCGGAPSTHFARIPRRDACGNVEKAVTFNCSLLFCCRAARARADGESGMRHGPLVYSRVDRRRPCLEPFAAHRGRAFLSFPHPHLPLPLPLPAQTICVAWYFGAAGAALARAPAWRATA